MERLQYTQNSRKYVTLVNFGREQFRIPEEQFKVCAGHYLDLDQTLEFCSLSGLLRQEETLTDCPAVIYVSLALCEVSLKLGRLLVWKHRKE